MRSGRRRKAATSTSGDGPGRKRRVLLIPLATLALLVGAIVAFAGPQATQAKFEFSDDNLVDNAPLFTADPPGDIDWNNFAPTTWTGTAPTRTAAKTFDGWSFTGLEDAQATTSDSGFAGGTKQDDDCASVGTAKAPNKDDLKRVYVASKLLADGDTFLSLAWVRIPQNTTSPSAQLGLVGDDGDVCLARLDPALPVVLVRRHLVGAVREDVVAGHHGDIGDGEATVAVAVGVAKRGPPTSRQ